jgi:hypothetical protein
MLIRALTALLLGFVLLFSGTESSKAQTIELLAGNTLNGAVNGTLLGGATMALNNDTDFAPLRIGLGIGTLYGIGTGAYDIASTGGQQLIVSGVFNDGNNTSIIVLLDTFYGAAAGAVITTSIMLIAERPIVEGLQYGSAIGAWAGFGFGLIDAFALAERITPSSTALGNSTNAADGLVGVRFNKSTSIGLVSPSVVQTYSLNETGITRKLNASVDLLNVKVSF